MEAELLHALEKHARVACERAGDPSHDFAHVLRVVAQARKIGEELGADLSVLIPAALLHDVVHVPKNHPDRAKASALAAEEARSLLMGRFGMDRTRAERIAAVILEHSFSAAKDPSTVESAILQDADRLDAIGAIGIARVFSCGTRLGSSFYDISDPYARARPLDDKRFALDHFETKLLKLESRFHTDPARKEAARRSAFLRAFLDQFMHDVAD